MKKRFLIPACVLALALPLGGFGSFMALSVIGAVSSISGGGCAPNSGTRAQPAGTADGTITLTTADGTSFNLDQAQLSNLRTMLGVANSQQISDHGIITMFATTLVEAKGRNLSNVKAYPESANYPNDGDGSDHDSLNPFQQRVESGWGTVAELMDVSYATRAFLGGPEGPNAGSPRGLLDIPGWETMPVGELAQTVQVSAHPERYANYEPAATQLLQQLGGSTSSCTSGPTGEIAMPLDVPFSMTDDFGPRSDTGTGASTWHPAVDLQNYPNPCGRPVYAMLPGTVTLSSELYLSIRHPDGFVVSYLHMYKSERLVDVGATVVPGQQIGVTGNVAPSTGCHLDVRINIQGNTNPQVAALPLDANGAGYVNPELFTKIWGLELCGPDCARNH
jgi:murein DD-endopeptidase MepM/ murein hydrolase activator NlpD